MRNSRSRALRISRTCPTPVEREPGTRPEAHTARGTAPSRSPAAASHGVELPQRNAQAPLSDPGGIMADSTQDFDMDIPEPELEFGDPTPTASDPVPAATPAPAPSSDPAQALSPAEREKVEAFVEKIDLTNAAGVLSFGVGAQKKVSDFSERALDGVRNNDLGEIGNDISSLIVTLKDLTPTSRRSPALSPSSTRRRTTSRRCARAIPQSRRTSARSRPPSRVTSARCSRTSRRSTSSTRSTRRTSRSSRCTWSPARRSSSRYAQTS